MMIPARHGYVLPTVIRHVLQLKEHFVFAAPTMGAKPGKIYAKDCRRKTVLISCIAMRWTVPVMPLLSAQLPVIFSFRRTGAKAGRRLTIIYPWCIRFSFRI